MHFKQKNLTRVEIKQEMIDTEKLNLHSSANNKIVGTAKTEYGFLI